MGQQLIPSRQQALVENASLAFQGELLMQGMNHAPLSAACRDTPEALSVIKPVQV